VQPFRLDVRLGNFSFSVLFGRTQRVVGINSGPPGGPHILLWDFDDVDFWQVIDALMRVQASYMLPTITVLDMGRENSYTAICPKLCSHREATEILQHTRFIDEAFFRMGFWRRYWTVRITDKNGRKPEPKLWIKSDVPPDVDLRSWLHFDEYEVPL